MSYTIGIDPGLTGAIARIGATSPAQVHDLPVVRSGKLAWIDGGAMQSLLLEIAPPAFCRVVIERAQAFPGQGRSGAFNYGVGFGSVLSILQACRLPIEFVNPGKWKRALGLGDVKNAALDKARLLYPECELDKAKHDGRAEALLIAHWHVRFNTGGAK